MREILEGLLVEHVLEMLEGQSKLQDSGVDVGSLGELSRKGGDDTGEGHRGGGDAVVQHLELACVGMLLDYYGDVVRRASNMGAYVPGYVLRRSLNSYCI